MRNLKEDRDDSDGEEMEHESGDSDKSSSSCESSDNSDSDDSSELDSDEYEKRRTSCMEQMSVLKNQFALLSEQLYKERITQIDMKLDEIKRGKAPEYRLQVAEFEKNKEIRFEVASLLRKYSLNNIQEKFRADELAAKQDFENKKLLLWDSIKERLEDEIKKLEEDRNSINIRGNLWFFEKGLKCGKGKHKGWKKGNKESRKQSHKPVSVSGPYIVYMLHDNDIFEDWTTIKKALSICRIQSELI